MVYTGNPTITLRNEISFIPLFKETVFCTVNLGFLRDPCADPK